MRHDETSLFCLLLHGLELEPLFYLNSPRFLVQIHVVDVSNRYF